MSPFVKAPNGDVYDLPKHVASGLVNGVDSEWSYTEEPPQRATGRGSKRGKAGDGKPPAAPRGTAKTTQKMPSDPPAADATVAGGDAAGTAEPSAAVDGESGESSTSTPAGAEGAAAEAAAGVPATADGDPSAASTAIAAASGISAAVKPAAKAPTQAWADYAQALGIDTEGLGRDQIREKVAAQAAAAK